MLTVDPNPRGCLSIAAISIIVVEDDLANAELEYAGRHGFRRGRGLGLDDVGND
jgi:hypothetical protein